MSPLTDSSKDASKGASPSVTASKQIFGSSDSDKQVRIVLAHISEALDSAGADVFPLDSDQKPSAVNPKGDFGNVSGITMWMATWLFGDSFVTLIDKPSLNPMSALIQGGGYILDKSYNLMWWFVIAKGGALTTALLGAGIGAPTGVGAVAGFGLGAIAGLVLSPLLEALAGIIWFFILIGLAAGVVLFYLLPLLPFMYFFFSVVNWVIEVAEAFISMPLFALSHLRIDGEGLLPQTAYQNWLILFGVLLRPLMIVVGMIVGSLVFNAGAYYLNSIYKYAIFAYNPDVTNGATGLDFSKVSGFGIVTYLVLYVYLIYMLANSSFKLIDQIPDKMMRWIGGPTPFTGDRPVELNNMHNAALMGYGVFTQGSQAMKGASDGLSQMAGNIRKHRTERGGGGGAGAGG
jgi:conjugal transfer/type IV secretion protein DotA/TraY